MKSKTNSKLMTVEMEYEFNYISNRLLSCNGKAKELIMKAWMEVWNAHDVLLCGDSRVDLLEACLLLNEGLTYILEARTKVGSDFNLDEAWSAILDLSRVLSAKA